MNLDPGTKKAFEAILNQKAELKEAQETLKESVKKLADEMGLKPAAVNRILGLVEKERSKGGILDDERTVVETAGEIA